MVHGFDLPTIHLTNVLSLLLYMHVGAFEVRTRTCFLGVPMSGSADTDTHHQYVKFASSWVNISMCDYVQESSCC